MPVCDPHRERKIAPSALAFDPNAKRGGSSVTYEKGLRDSVAAKQTIVMASQRELMQAKQETMLAVTNAERRAQHWVGDYMHTLHWDILMNHTVWLSGWHPVPYDHEVIRAYGARYDNKRLYGGGGDPLSYWYHRALDSQSGMWWYYARLSIAFTAPMGVTGAKLGLFRNNVLYVVLDEMDADMSGDGALILDCVLSGGVHVPVNGNDVIDIRLYTSGPLLGSETFIAPSSLGGYVCGHRERCDTTVISSPVSGFGFTFTA